jgi:putative acetyltransferase
VIVLGHPGYYPRFGFSTELGSRIQCPIPGAGDAWMALEPAPGALSGVTGTVRYPAAFGLAEHCPSKALRISVLAKSAPL